MICFFILNQHYEQCSFFLGLTIYNSSRITKKKIFTTHVNIPQLKIKNLTFIDINSPKINKITKDFYRDNKRVSNKKIKKILGWTPKFENYKLGLKEILNIINGKNTANNPLS